MKLPLSAALVALCISSSLAATPADQPSPAASRAIDSASWLAHVTTLSSDQFEGRAAGTPGEKLTTDYLQQQFKQLGLAPGNPDGSYVQAVPVVAIALIDSSDRIVLIFAQTVAAVCHVSTHPPMLSDTRVLYWRDI